MSGGGGDPVLGTRVHKDSKVHGQPGGLQGGQAGSGVQCGVPSSGRGGQPWESFSGKEDGEQTVWSREGQGLGLGLVQPVPGQVPTISET